MTSGGTPYYYVTDDQGAPSALVDNSGAKQGRWDYSPTGGARAGNNSLVDQPFGYTGAYLDSTGLYKMGTRYYDPTLGRFTQPDPSGKETNAYLYATGNPVNAIDPTGTSTLGCVAGGVSIVGGVLSVAGGIAGAVGSGGLGTPASVAAIGGGIGLVGTGLGFIDACTS
ncbi:RHS repeat-associated core domain-containing protein [Streptomyces griseoluteus]